MDDQAYHRPLDAYEEYIVRKRKAEAPTLGDTKKIPVIREPNKVRLDADAIGFMFFFGWIIVLCWLGAWVFQKLGIGGGVYIDRLGPQVERSLREQLLTAPPLRTS